MVFDLQQVYPEYIVRCTVFRDLLPVGCVLESKRRSESGLREPRSGFHEDRGVKERRQPGESAEPIQQGRAMERL